MKKEICSLNNTVQNLKWKKFSLKDTKVTLMLNVFTLVLKIMMQ